MFHIFVVTFLFFVYEAKGTEISGTLNDLLHVICHKWSLTVVISDDRPLPLVMARTGGYWGNQPRKCFIGENRILSLGKVERPSVTVTVTLHFFPWACGCARTRTLYILYLLIIYLYLSIYSISIIYLIDSFTSKKQEWHIKMQSYGYELRLFPFLAVTVTLLLLSEWIADGQMET